MSAYVTCESVAAIVVHIRRIANTPVHCGGHVRRPFSLCGKEVAWDTRLPVSTATCRGCLDLYKKEMPSP